MYICITGFSVAKLPRNMYTACPLDNFYLLLSLREDLKDRIYVFSKKETFITKKNLTIEEYNSNGKYMKKDPAQTNFFEVLPK